MEKDLNEIKLILEWSDTFKPIIVVSNNDINVFKNNLFKLYESSNINLLFIKEFYKKEMDLLNNNSVWLDLREQSDEDYYNTMRRLNVGRGYLEKISKREIYILVTKEQVYHFPMYAPDLFSVREKIIEY